MPLTAGTRVGPYEILAPLGAGGMGEVYRARDPRLNRDVAIKTLPELFSIDRDRISRFEREAQILAALTHPNIAGIYGVEESQGGRHLVLELIPGESLAQRLEAGPVSLPDSLAIARQIADALEAAHDKGIVHRDLKPGNVMITPEGQVKVLDFGLAKALSPDGSGSMAISGTDQSPTFTSPAMTAMGVIIGTAAYMAPEQAKGRAADKRCDIWAFGCVLYELLTGTRAFAGEDVSDTLAAVLRAEPDWTTLPARTPPFLERLLRRCLNKDRRQRLPDISIARYEIDEYLAGRMPEAPPLAASPPRGRRTAAIAMGSAILAALATAAVYGLILWPAPPAERVTKFDVKPPAGSRAFLVPIGAGVDVVISPDGSLVVYRVSVDNTSDLALRRLGELESTVLPGTTNATSMSFSPDGSKLAFQAEGKLQVLAIGASAPVLICPMTTMVIGTKWLDANTILFAERGIFKVAAVGGFPEKVVAPKEGSAHVYSFPEVAPGGDAILFTVNEGPQRNIVVHELKTGSQKVVAQNASFPKYVPTGHLLFIQGGRLVAARWNATARQLDGAPVPLDLDVALKLSGAATFDVAADGTFAGVSGAPMPYRSQFIWTSRTGQTLGRIGTEDLDYPRYPRISPDGKRFAATIGAGSRGHIWMFDLAGGTPPLKLTMAHHNILPVFMPDGKNLVFRRISTGVLYGTPTDPEGLMIMPSDGSSLVPKTLVRTLVGTSPIVDVSPDGQWLLFADTSAAGGHDILMRPVDKDEQPKPWIAESFAERSPAFSPDGKWVAYVSNQTGSWEVWVRPFPGPGAPVRVSSSGGQEPVWGEDSKELFYQSQNTLMAAAIAVKTDAAIQFGERRMLFRGGFIPYQDFTPRTYDVAADGRFLMIEDRATPTQATVTVVTGWGSTLNSKLGR